MVGWLKKLVCGYGDEDSIPCSEILNLVLNDYNMITYFYFKCNLKNFTLS